MKKLLTKNINFIISILLLISVFVFFEFYLSYYVNNVANNFFELNKREILRIDSQEISQKLNILSKQTNWICIIGKDAQITFFNESKDKDCNSTLFQRRASVSSIYANKLTIELTLRAPKETELSFIFFFFISLSFIILILKIQSTFLTTRRKADEKLVALARQFSHDIRSPITLLKSIEAESFNNNQHSKKIFIESIKRIESISMNLLSSTKVEILSAVNIHLILENFIELKKQEYKTIIFHPNLNCQNVYCEIVIGDFLSSLSNLVNNAIESKDINQNNFNVIINAKINLDFVEIEIIDNGIGIEKDILNKLQNNLSLTTKKNGNGIGVKHAHDTISSFKGKFRIDSKLKSGTVITLSLPIINNITSPSPISVLLDDDELTRMNWEYKAKKAKKELLIFKNKEELYSQLESLDKSTTFYIDSELGNIKGEEIAKDLNQKGFTTIYMASGHSVEHFQELTFLKGVIDKNPPF